MQDDMAAQQHALVLTNGDQPIDNANCGDRNCSLEKIKLVAAIDAKDELRKARIIDITAQLERQKGKLDRIHSGDQVNQEVENVRTEMDQKFAAGKDYLENAFKAKIDSLRTKAREATTVTSMITVRQELGETWKTLNAEAMKTWIEFSRTFMSTAATLGRGTIKGKGRGKGKSRRPPPRGTHPQPVVHKIMMDWTDASHNTSASVFEAKGGLRPALIEAASADAFERVSEAPPMKKALKHVKDALKRGVQAATQPIAGGKQMMRSFEDRVMNCVGMDTRSACVLPRQPWAQKIFAFEYVGCAEHYCHHGWTPYGMISVCLVTAGEVAFLGIPTHCLEGADFAAKRESFCRLTADAMKAKVDHNGFFARFTDGHGPNGECAIMIPTGFFVAWAGDDATFLRWACAADACDKVRVSQSLRGLIQGFPEYSSADSSYRPLAQHFGLDLS